MRLFKPKHSFDSIISNGVVATVSSLALTADETLVIDGKLDCESAAASQDCCLIVNGSATFNNDISFKKIVVNGSLKVTGAIKVDELIITEKGTIDLQELGPASAIYYNTFVLKSGGSVNCRLRHMDKINNCNSTLTYQ